MKGTPITEDDFRPAQQVTLIKAVSTIQSIKAKSQSVSPPSPAPNLFQKLAISFGGVEEVSIQPPDEAVQKQTSDTFAQMVRAASVNTRPLSLYSLQGTLSKKMKHRKSVWLFLSHSIQVFVDKEQLLKAKQEKQSRIRNYLENFHEKGKLSTVDVIDQIYKKHTNRSNLHVNLFSTRHLLGKDQYVEFKNDIQRHLLRQLQNAQELHDATSTKGKQDA